MGSLVAMTGLRQFLFDALESSGPNVAWFIVQVIPLLVPLPGLLSGRILATFTVCMASLLYFVHGVMAAFDPNFLVYGLFEIGFALGLCASTSMLLRKLRT